MLNLRKTFGLKRGSRAKLALLAGITAASVVFSGGAAAANVNILETGSTLLYPLFNLWVPVYTGEHKDVNITTQGTGSGTGIAESISGVAQIGASDAYLSDALMKQHPSMANIPLAISAQMINYNLPGLNKVHLNLNGPVLAGIYAGKIQKWNDPQIQHLNPRVKLPDHDIIPVHRTDGSGDSFIFTQYLSFSTPWWKDQVGFGTSPSWPAVSSGIGANGNPGMVQALQTSPYAIAYIGVSWKKQVEEAGLGEARLENRDHRFVMLTRGTVMAAAGAMVHKTPADQRISLVYAPGAESYPIINYEYAIVKKDQPNRETANAIREMLSWAIDPRGGNATHFMEKVNFIALPGSVARQSKRQIDEIR